MMRAPTYHGRDTMLWLLAIFTHYWTSTVSSLSKLCYAAQFILYVRPSASAFGKPP